MHIPEPLRLSVIAAPFDDPDWIYEIKHDGFRALAVIEHGNCRFISRNKHKLYGLRELTAALAREVNAETAILDGELAVPDHHGRTVFASMMKRRHEARFFDAIREYETVLEMGDGDINTRTFLCHQYWVTNRYREAESCLKYVLRHDPHNKSAIQLYPYVTQGLEHSKHEP